MATETQSPKLKEFVYEFKSLKKGEHLNLNSKSKIFLIIDDKETDIEIEKLFVNNASIDDEDIMGYSILQMLTNSTKLKIDDNITLDITFIDKVSEKKFYVSMIRRPIAYDDDIEITTEKRLEYLDLLLTTVSRNSEPSVSAETPEEAAAKAAAAIKAEEDRMAAETEQKRIAEEKEASESVMGGISWEEERNKRLNEGLTEYINGDFRFFYKPASDNEEAIVGMYYLEPGEYYVVDLYEEDITEEYDSYTFEDGDEIEYVATLNKKDGKLTVEEAKINT